MGSGQTSAAHVESVWKIRAAKTGLQFLRSSLTFVTGFSFNGFDASKHSVVIPEAFVSPWKTDQKFVDTYSKIRGFTTVDMYRCYELWHLLGQVINFGRGRPRSWSLAGRDGMPAGCKGAKFE